MGLFKKRATDPDEMERLKSEIAAMGARLDAADEAKQELGLQVQGLTAKLREHDEQQAAPPPKPPAPEVTAADVDMLRARVQRLAERVEGTGDDDQKSEPAGLDEMRERLDALTQRLEDTIQVDDDPADPVEVAELRERIGALDAKIEMLSTSGQPADADAIESLQARVDQLTARFETPLSTPPPPAPPATPGPTADMFHDVHERLDALGARLDAVDTRITAISTELANQLAELGGDLDALGPGEAPSSELLDELRDAQTRLASEQARYQIAFRQDLAELAARLKHS